MEFWGVEVKPGEPLKVQPEFGKLIHISQAALGEVKDAKGAKNVPLRLKIDDKNFIIGTLSAEDRTQLMFDLVFEREFELSHDWKNGSVYFIGYLADEPASDEEFSDFDDESEDELVGTEENGKIVPKSGDVKAAKSILAAAAAAAGKAKAGTKKEEQPESDDDDSESDSDDEMALDGLQGEDSSDVSGDDSEDEEEELPKLQQTKKRPAESEQKTPSKKAKSATPDKSGKKGHTATPIPSKAAGNKSKEQTPKSGGQLSCKSCSKTFTSGNALQAHAKAKHGK